MPSGEHEATPPWALGRAIAARRSEIGLARNDLVERSGLSYPYVAELEKGQKRPSTRSLDSLARALELSASELMERAEVLASGQSTFTSSRAAAAPVRAARQSWFHDPADGAGAGAVEPTVAESAALPMMPPPAAAPAQQPKRTSVERERERVAGGAASAGAARPSAMPAPAGRSGGPAPERLEEMVRRVVREELRAAGIDVDAAAAKGRRRRR